MEKKTNALFYRGHGYKSKTKCCIICSSNCTSMKDSFPCPDFQSSKSRMQIDNRIDLLFRKTLANKEVENIKEEKEKNLSNEPAQLTEMNWFSYFFLVVSCLTLLFFSVFAHSFLWFPFILFCEFFASHLQSLDTISVRVSNRQLYAVFSPVSWCEIKTVRQVGIYL